ncbi:polysaccharide biosynthesis tyrosine autokinase [Arthrobacter sp. NPDC058097]|uniref:polysaccharide biosynthesis tyrosine autokinase n=1 Tax=Arthrobacter sp. NPDC058097 TaxID=3346340 RepID=UPI0036DA5332
MAVHDYLLMVRRNWLIVVACTLIGLSAGGAASLLVKPSYTAETQLFVAIQGAGSVQELQQGNTFSQARVQSYVKTVVAPIVLQPTIDKLGLPMSAEELATKVKASTDLNTVLINIAVTDNSPVQAAAIAQGVADSLVQAVDSLEKPKSGGTSPVGLSVITPATAPTSPSAPNTRLNLMVGFVAGFALGLGGAALRSAVDRQLRGESEVRRITDAPVLGRISYSQEAAKNPLLTEASMQGPRAESYRQLRTNLQFASVSAVSRTIAVTSSMPGEGKSTTAANLAIALAQSGQSVCLVDADLRRPMVSEYLGLERNAGLTTTLVGDADVNDLLQPWGDGGLYVLTSGQIPPNPSELLGSDEMKQLLIRLEQVFDAVIIDAPPLLPVTDASVLAQQVGGVLVVVGSRKIKQHDLEKSLGALQLVGGNLLGVVLNLLPSKGPDAYSYEYRAYDAHEVSPKASSGMRRRTNGSFNRDNGRKSRSDTRQVRPGDRTSDLSK